MQLMSECDYITGLVVEICALESVDCSKETRFKVEKEVTSEQPLCNWPLKRLLAFLKLSRDGLRGSSVNGDWLSQWEMAVFDPLQNRHPLTSRQNICHRWSRRWPLQLCQIWCTSVHGGLLGEWV